MRSSLRRHMRQRHLVLVGPTASGKSALALQIGQRRRADGATVEIVSADSMSVYRGMDIGTAKPGPAERAAVVHHLVDIVEPTEEYSVSRFQADAHDALKAIESRGSHAILVGGTGLYVDAVVDGLTIPGQWADVRAALETRPTSELWAELQALDPEAATRIEPGNHRRMVRALEVTIGSGRPFSSFGPGLQRAREQALDRFVLVGLRVPREVLAERIAARYLAQMEGGFLDEVRALEQRYGERLSRTARQALGYRELLAHLDGTCSLDNALEQARRRTVAFAKRQERWFRRDPRIHWHDALQNPRLVDDVLADWMR